MQRCWLFLLSVLLLTANAAALAFRQHRRSRSVGASGAVDELLKEMQSTEIALAGELDTWCSGVLPAHQQLLAEVRVRAQNATVAMVALEQELAEKQTEAAAAMSLTSEDPIAQLEYTMSEEFKVRKDILVLLKAAFERGRAAYHDWDIIVRNIEAAATSSITVCNDQKNYTGVFLTELLSVSTEVGAASLVETDSLTARRHGRHVLTRGKGPIRALGKKIKEKIQDHLSSTEPKGDGPSPGDLASAKDMALKALKSRRANVEAMAKLCREAGEQNAAVKAEVAAGREREIRSHEDLADKAVTSSADLDALKKQLGGDVGGFDTIFQTELGGYAKMSEKAYGEGVPKAVRALLDSRHQKYMSWETELHGSYGRCNDGFVRAKELLGRRVMYHDEQKLAVKLRAENALSSSAVPGGCQSPEAYLEALKDIDAKLTSYGETFEAAAK